MLRWLLVPLVLGLLGACSTVLEERSIGRSFDDTNASVAIKSNMLRAEGFALDGVDVEVTEGIALLTGRVPREDDRRMAECLAWSSVAVRNVANDLEVGPGQGFRDRTRDTQITTRVNARLISDRNVRSINFNVETRNGVVYLLGVARNRGELDRATTHASLVDGVEEVISYVRVAGADPNLPARGERRAAACAGEALPSLDPGNSAPNSGPQLLGGSETNQ
ncbi:BON domain-containing protein [Maricaulis parjimensis]|uniref:BON domain-containing protein n=1 Tax=Maricaulis parjimensis TaxID=144023 RepID=UPI0019397D84|nr:BON domain-containing protein [Maricaulis parjimensis]